MDNLDTKEWLLTNGLGSFASGTICDAHTRTYHGWLSAALDPPGQRTLLLARIDASLEIAGQSVELGVNFWKSGAVAPLGYRLLQGFEVDPVPTWIWGQSHWQLTRRLLMPYGLVSTATGAPQFCNRVLIQYQYHGHQPAVLKLRPLIGDRIFHYQQQAQPDLQFAQWVEPNGILLQAKRSDWFGTPWQLTWTHGDYQPDGIWYWGYRYPEETQRGLADVEDLYSPGCLMVMMAPGDSVTLEACVRVDGFSSPLQADSFEQALMAERQRLGEGSGEEKEDGGDAAREPRRTREDGGVRAEAELRRRLLQAGDQFLVYRASTKGPTMIAGYPWFNDWGRDTLIALPGLTLATGRFDLARGLLRTFGQYCQQGLIPNAFPDAGAKPFYNTIDAALWWVESLGLYLEASQDWEFLAEQYAVVWGIYKGLMAGTLYSIRVDAFDGLVTWDSPQVALTWMDAVVEAEPVTPRRGKPVEINALWYSALCWAQQWAERLQQSQSDFLPMDAATLTNQARRYATQAEQVKRSLQIYWNLLEGYLFDTINPDDSPDRTIRPNAVIALSLQHCGFSEAIGRSVVQVAQQRLLTPYGLRSLDPADPQYIGQYRGGIWQRDRAYHQGTVWPWLIGPFIRAWQRFYPDDPVPFDWQPLLHHFQHQACLGSISEMFDGDAPHAPKGAIAQAWSVAEVIRHWVQPPQERQDEVD
ncbi:amylo-alpha-1,6-glucosidase [Leptolyngbya sp. NK1-12]|uniref:Amylo-alpha-1,6-glucosidase n=1 Tax=Leptolyngbya sp. NK1-12 TaxID=2547451 RepID=A0AA96WB05_9CYAN|nr:amylo-alpha-1,6-glucosidase [Leptolyngbya sp. NK1-12]